jgi:hypothetical protein
MGRFLSIGRLAWQPHFLSIGRLAWQPHFLSIGRLACSPNFLVFVRSRETLAALRRRIGCARDGRWLVPRFAHFLSIGRLAWQPHFLSIGRLACSPQLVSRPENSGPGFGVRALRSRA